MGDYRFYLNRVLGRKDVFPEIIDSFSFSSVFIDEINLNIENGENGDMILLLTSRFSYTNLDGFVISSGSDSRGFVLFQKIENNKKSYKIELDSNTIYSVIVYVVRNANVINSEFDFISENPPELINEKEGKYLYIAIAGHRACFQTVEEVPDSYVDLIEERSNSGSESTAHRSIYSSHKFSQNKIENPTSYVFNVDVNQPHAATVALRSN